VSECLDPTLYRGIKIWSQRLKVNRKEAWEVFGNTLTGFLHGNDLNVLGKADVQDFDAWRAG
jgi:hypothetical protein